MKTLLSISHSWMHSLWKLCNGRVAPIFCVIIAGLYVWLWSWYQTGNQNHDFRVFTLLCTAWEVCPNGYCARRTGTLYQRHLYHRIWGTSGLSIVAISFIPSLALMAKCNRETTYSLHTFAFKILTNDLHRLHCFITPITFPASTLLFSARNRYNSGINLIHLKILTPFCQPNVEFSFSKPYK